MTLILIASLYINAQYCDEKTIWSTVTQGEV